MQELDLIVHTNGRTYKQIKRDSFRAMYLSNEGYYEVFRIPIKPQEEIFGIEYPERESYPCSEDFGYTAWCTGNLKRAEELYENIEPKKEKDEISMHLQD